MKNHLIRIYFLSKDTWSPVKGIHFGLTSFTKWFSPVPTRFQGITRVGKSNFHFICCSLRWVTFSAVVLVARETHQTNMKKVKLVQTTKKNVQDKSSQARKPMKVRLEWFLSQEKKRFAPNLNSKDLQSSGTRVEREGKSTKKPTRLDLSTTICLLSIWLSVAIKNILICSFSTVWT